MKRVLFLLLMMVVTLAPAASALDIGAQALFIDEGIALYGGTLGLGYPLTLRGHALATAEHEGVRLTLLGGDLLFNLKIGPIIPYGGVGVGLLTFHFEEEEFFAQHTVVTPTTSSLTLPYAVGGLALAITSQIEIYGEYRHFTILHDQIPLGEMTFPGYGGGLRIRF